MVTFKSLFGIEKHQIKRTCVLAPILSKGWLESFNIKNFIKAMPFSSGNNNDLTLIHTHIGAPFAGDAVLYLQDTSCENIILLGSCGLVKRTGALDIGKEILINSCYSLESFSSLLNKTPKYPFSRCNDTLLKIFIEKNKEQAINIAKCATFGSLKLEEDFLSYLIKEDISALDMECSAVFNAAEHIGKKAIALFYITDILKEKHVLRKLTRQEKIKVQNAANNCISMIMNFSEAS